MQVHVISLTGSLEHRDQIRSQMQRLGVDFKFFDAINGWSGADSFEAISHEHFRIGTGRELTAGEVGCYASHLSLWAQCAAAGEPFLIIEDDARLVESIFASALQQTMQWIGEYGFIRLQMREGRRRQSMKQLLVDRSSGFDLFYCMRYPFGATSYAITPEVGAAFAAASRELTGPVDLFIKEFWAHRQPLFALSPAAVLLSDLAGETTIRGRSIEKPGISLRCRRLMYKLRGQIRRFRANRDYAVSHRKRHVEFQLRQPASDRATSRGGTGAK